VLSKTSKGR